MQTIFLPVVGLVDPDILKPGDLVGVNKDSYLILDTLPSEYDSRVKAMEVDEKPTEDYSDIGGLDKQVGRISLYTIQTSTRYFYLSKNCGTQEDDGEFSLCASVVDDLNLLELLCRNCMSFFSSLRSFFF